MQIRVGPRKTQDYQLTCRKASEAILSPTPKPIRIIAAVACVLLAQASVKAAVLGDIRVESALNQPLQAHVFFAEGVQPGAGCVRAQVESVEGNPLAQVNVQAVRAEASPALLLTTLAPIREPVVNVSLQIVCRNQENRDYTVLLDPGTPRNASVANQDQTYEHDNGRFGMALRPAKAHSQFPATQEAESLAGSSLDNGPRLRLSLSLSDSDLANIQRIAADDVSSRNPSATTNETSRLSRVDGVLPIVPGSPRPLISAEKPIESPAKRTRKYLLHALLGCMGLLVTLILVIRGRPGTRNGTNLHKRYRHDVLEYANHPGIKQLESIPYVKPNLHLAPRLGRAAHSDAMPTAIACNTSQAQITEPHASCNGESHDDLPARFPEYHADEVKDELQLAQFWASINQPMRAIEVLESRCGQDVPTSSQVWEQLLELYRITGNLDKYRKLTIRYQTSFPRNPAIPNAALQRPVDAAPVKLHRMRP